MNWRTSGDTTFAAWDALLPAASQIKKRGESRACYDAARPLSKLCLGMLKGESSFATDFDAVPASMNNPLNLKHPDSGSFITFDSIAECIRAWRARITSTTYKGGVYANTITVKDLVSVYAPGYDNNNVPAYTATIEGVVRSLPDLVKDDPPVSTPTTKPVFGRVPIPDNLELHDITGINSAWDDLGTRRKLGTCTHRMIGSLLGTHGYFQGEAKTRALTDFGIGGPWDGANDGVIYQWIGGSSNAAPWANGAADHLEGDGVAFVQKLGISAVNRDLRSIELSDGGQHLRPYGPNDTPKQFAQHVALTAYVFDQAEVPWDAFPVNPAVGIVTYLEHWEFSSKECPFAPVRAMTETSQQHIRALLKMHQTGQGAEPIPEPPPSPVEPEKPYSASLDQTFLRERWGRPRRVYKNGSLAKDSDGRIKYYTWNPKWVPCSAWIARAREEKAFPRPGDWHSVDNRKPNGPVSFIAFEGGWLLQRFDDTRGWQWAK